MAKIQVFLEPHETEEDVNDLLIKALSHHESGGEHQEPFHQPAARAAYSKMDVEHRKMWGRILREISAAIDEEASRDTL